MLAIIAIFILETLWSAESGICFVTFGYAVNCHEGILLIHPTSEMTQERETKWLIWVPLLNEDGIKTQ